MDDNSRAITTHRFSDNVTGGGDDDQEEEQECRDIEAWETLSKSFKEVQSVLDQNRGLIQQVNENQRSMVPRNLARNVELIREINGNISRVIGLYSNLSSDFTGIVQQWRGSKGGNREGVASKN